MTRDGLSRRTFIKRGATAGVAALALPTRARAQDQPTRDAETGIEEMGIAEMAALMESGDLSARALVRNYLQRIAVLDQRGPHLRSIIEVNPDAPRIATELDRERHLGNLRGPLHGIPIVLKDNIDTADSLDTTAGSLALVGSSPLEDATVAARLRDAGAIILGKANLSEWANFRGFQSSSGWSARGGQAANPYIVDRNPCGSSSGSAVAVSANLAAAALGTETDGSIVCPSSANGLVGIKPTIGLTSRAGVVPISRTQDTVGPMGRTVADAAVVLGALTGLDSRDPATAGSDGKFFSDYTDFVDPSGLDGARIGVARELFFFSPETAAVAEAAVDTLAAAGAEVVDPVLFPSFAEFATSPSEFEVLLWEFKTDIALYLAGRTQGSPRTLADLIEFNNTNADRELTFFGQEIFELSQTRGELDDPEYLNWLDESRRISRAEGLDAVLDSENLDALIAPTGSPAWPTDLINGDHFLGGSSSYAAMAGYPLVTVPAGDVFGLPVGVTFMGRAYSEPTLIRIASGFEATVGARRQPEFLPTLVPEGSPPGRRPLASDAATDALQRKAARGVGSW